MTKKLNTILVGIVLVGTGIWISGCNLADIAGPKTTTTTTIPYDSYFPLISGHVITYEVFSYWETQVSSQEITTLETNYLETWQYVGFVPLTSTLEVFKINVISNGNTIAHYYREDSNGVYNYGTGTNPTTETERWLSYPLTGFQETISTRAGTFDCIRPIGVSVPEVRYDRWFARDIGLIKYFYGYMGVGNGYTSREIVSKNF